MFDIKTDYIKILKTLDDFKTIKEKEDFIREIKDSIGFDFQIQLFSLHNNFSIDFIREMREYWGKNNLLNLVSKFNLTEAQIEEFKDILLWSKISQYQTLSEQFMNKWSDYIHWNWAIMVQKMSREFFENHKLWMGEEVYNLYKSTIY